MVDPSGAAAGLMLLSTVDAYGISGTSPHGQQPEPTFLVEEPVRAEKVKALISQAFCPRSATAAVGASVGRQSGAERT
jgi:hypothetical protein